MLYSVIGQTFAEQIGKGLAEILRESLRIQLLVLFGLTLVRFRVANYGVDYIQTGHFKLGRTLKI